MYHTKHDATPKSASYWWPVGMAVRSPILGTASMVVVGFWPRCGSCCACDAAHNISTSAIIHKLGAANAHRWHHDNGACVRHRFMVARLSWPCLAAIAICPFPLRLLFPFSLLLLCTFPLLAMLRGSFNRPYLDPSTSLQ
jgi:hypothetical protein